MLENTEPDLHGTLLYKDLEYLCGKRSIALFSSACLVPSITVVVLGERFGRRPDGRGAITTRRSRGPGGCGVGPSASPRAGSPARTSGSARGPANPPSFFGRRQLVRVMAHHGHHGKGQHHQRDVPMPAVPGAGLVVSKPQLGLRRLERVLNRPAPPLDAHKRLDRGPGWAPG